MDGASKPARRPVFRRRWQRALAACAVVVAVLAAVTARLFIWPIQLQGVPPMASAIVLLAGPGDRMPVALRLAREHAAPVLVVSTGHLGYGGPCPAPVPGVRTICFQPNPADTRGEAEYVGQLAQRYGWSSLILVVTPMQAVRAQLLVARCFAGPTSVATAPVSDWPYQVAYGWGAFVKAVFTHRSC